MITKYRLYYLLALALVQAVPLAQAQSNSARAGALSPAVEKIANAATTGDPEAQYRLAQLYSSGNGVPKNAETAALWLQKAAMQGHANAQYSLGTSYLLGDGVPKNPTTALEWLSKSAQQNNTLAQTNLGAMYLNGDGVAQDFRQALFWLEKAGAQGEPLAQFSLGKMYQNGYGATTDATMAAQWYTRAATQNYAPAVQALAQLKMKQAAASAPPAPLPLSPLPLSANRNQSVEAPSEQTAVLNVVQAWAAAWSRKDIGAYFSYYADDFHTPNDESRNDWAALRRTRIEGRKRIAVTIITPQVKIYGSKATVTFTQKYASDNFNETSQKTLLLARRGDAWKILQETIPRTSIKILKNDSTA